MLFIPKDKARPRTLENRGNPSHLYTSYIYDAIQKLSGMKTLCVCVCVRLRLCLCARCNAGIFICMCFVLKISVCVCTGLCCSVHDACSAWAIYSGAPWEVTVELDIWSHASFWSFPCGENEYCFQNNAIFSFCHGEQTLTYLVVNIIRTTEAYFNYLKTGNT